MSIQRYETIFNATKNAFKKMKELDRNVKGIEENINNKIEDLVNIQYIIVTKYHIYDNLESFDSIKYILKNSQPINPNILVPCGLEDIKNEELFKIINKYKILYEEILILKEKLNKASEESHQCEVILMMELYKNSKNDIEKYIKKYNVNENVTEEQLKGKSVV